MRMGFGLAGIGWIVGLRFGWAAVLIMSVCAMLFALWRMSVAIHAVPVDPWGTAYRQAERLVTSWAAFVAFSALVALVGAIMV